MKKILLTLFVGLVIVACEKDEEVVNYDDVEIELRAKGGNKGKPDNPDDTPSGISYEYLDGLNGASGIPKAINGNKWVVGESDNKPVVWKADNTATELSTLSSDPDYDYGFAFDINDNGLIVGTSGDPTAWWGGPRAVKWLSFASSANSLDEHFLPDIYIEQSEARGVNNAGVICGSLVSEDIDLGRWIPWVWSNTQVPHFDGHYTKALDINDAGVVVGEAEIGYNTEIEHAFRWSEDDGLTDLGTLGVIDGLWSKATAINEAGQIVGWSQLDNGYIRGFIWTKTEGMVILPTLLGRTFIEDISENGHIVGNSMVSTGGNSNRGHPHAYLSPGGVDPADRIAIDLGTAGGKQSEAWAVADKNGDSNIVYVVGRNYSRKSGSRVVLWTVDLSKL